MIDGDKIINSVEKKMKNYHMPKYHMYFYKGDTYKAEKADIYNLENLGQMNQLKVNIRHIITDYITYKQYTNYRIELFYINHVGSFDHVATLREYYNSEEEKELLEEYVNQDRLI